MLLDETYVASLARWLARWPIAELPRRDDPSRRPLSCPVCARPMVASVQLGVAIDVCPRDGAWLDGGELQTILTAARRLNDDTHCDDCDRPLQFVVVDGVVLRRCVGCKRVFDSQEL